MGFHYRPWVGSNYWSENILKTKLLVLGESHYDDDDPEATNYYTQAYIDGKNHRFWTSVMQLVLGKPACEIDRNVFWHSVSFYNFIQEPAGDGPRKRPTSEMWAKGGPAFLDILEELKPNHVIVLGSALWENLPSNGRRGKDLVIGTTSRDTWIYDYKGGEALCTWVYHPSSPKGSSTLEAYPYVAALIKYKLQTGIIALTLGINLNVLFS